MTIKDFLNPTSMITPTIAGAVTMTITNTICYQFEIPGKWPQILALVLSFVFGILVFNSEMKPIWKKFVFYVINSLIIFNCAVGTQTLGDAATRPDEKHEDKAMMEEPSNFILLPGAYAQPQQAKGWCCVSTVVKNLTKDECLKSKGRFYINKDDASTECPDKSPIKTNEKRFFRSWF